MTWSNTLVYSCESVCFVLFYCLILWMYFSTCLALSDVYVPYSDAIDADAGSVEWICMYVCMYGMEEKNYVFKTCLIDENFLCTW